VNLEGCVRHTGKHAAGVIVGNDALQNSMPLMSDGTTVTTQWEKETLEGLNFLKADILGLRTLDIVHDTLRIVGRDTFNSMKYDDLNVLKEFTAGNSLGTFQFETAGMQKTLRKVKPVSFEELFAINALERPGSADSIDDFVRNRATGKFDCLGNEALRPILGSTYGIILYQEQIMTICVTIAGFSLSESDLVRRTISRKKGIEDFRTKFIDGAVKNGFDGGWAGKMFSVIEKSGDYGFNKSHAVAYTQLGFMTMFLKVYFPLEFLSVVLSHHPYSKNNVFKINAYIREAGRLGIKVQGWDINASKAFYTFDKDTDSMRMGFCSLPHIGKAAKHIESLQPFTSFGNFYKRVNKSTTVRQNVMKVLIDSGCFDSLEKNRLEMSKWIGVKPTKMKIADNSTPVPIQQNLI
jgi:DNA polymerase-3 subunit alpha